MRTEFEVFKSEKIKSEQSLQNLDTLTFLDKVIDFNSIQELNYTNCVVNETLRFQAPLQSSSLFEVKEDAKIGNMNFKAGATIAFAIGLVHFNESEWQRPDEFLPQRFDNEDALSLTP